MSINVAIDGPAGAGKSTVARKLAEKLNFIYVDTGAMYRAMAFYFLENQITAENDTAIAQACREVDVTIAYENGEQQVILNGENVSGLIRTEAVGNMASATSVYPVVREKLVELQRKLARQADVVMDGRDIGTCVLPKAQVKIYLTASVKTRAQRRYAELTAKGERCDREEIERDISERDMRDMNREVSPLKQAKDAVLVDSSDLDIEGVTEKILSVFREKTAALKSF